MPTVRAAWAERKLDRAGTGYATRAAATNVRLSQSFDRCDTDRDARVTRAEYQACIQSPRR